MSVSNSFTTFKQKGIVALLTLGLIAASVGCVYLWWTHDQTVISDDSIREEIKPVTKLLTYEYDFTQVLYIDDAGNPFGVDNPFTTKRYVATIDGKADIGMKVDDDNLEVKVHPSKLDKSKIESVDVFLPHSEIVTLSTDPKSLKKYVEDNGFLNWNQVSTDDLNKLLRQADKDQRKKVQDSGMLEKSDKRAIKLIKKQIMTFCGDGVKVNVEFRDGDGK